LLAVWYEGIGAVERGKLGLIDDKGLSARGWGERGGLFLLCAGWGIIAGGQQIDCHYAASGHERESLHGLTASNRGGQRDQLIAFWLLNHKKYSFFLPIGID
jgi:hypothetical protein